MKPLRLVQLGAALLLTLASAAALAPTVSHADGPAAVDGLVAVQSSRDFATTVAQAEQAIAGRGLTLMATVDHAANAQTVDATLRPTTLFIFGNPKVGTQLMHVAQTTGIDLPMKLLVWQDDTGAVWVSYNDPAWLGGRHHVAGKDALLTKVQGALSGIAADAARAAK